jgi:hypothetical protein
MNRTECISVVVKESTIRGKNVRNCPFGLPIPEGCENAGNSIIRMAPIEDEKESDGIAKANRLVYAYHKECRKCPYADKILDEYGKVDCDFGDTAAGKRVPAFRGSPLFPQTFHGIGLDGLYGYPLGFYADNNESRNLFFGLFSLLGREINNFVKLSVKYYDKCDKPEKDDLLQNLLIKLEKIKEEYTKTFDKVEKYLSKQRQKYENKRSDTGLLYHLSDKWFGPRQVNR